MIKKHRPVSCPNLASGRPYFANNMINIQDIVLVVILSTRIAQYDHFEAKNGQ